MKRSALWLLVVCARSTLVHGQSSPSFSGFLTREVVYEWSDSRTTPNMYGFIREEGSTSKSHRETITVRKGRAEGRLAYNKRESTTFTTQVTGGCADGSSGTTVLVESTQSVEVAHAAGSATCEAYFDDFGGWADCFVDQEHDYTTEETTLNSSASGCAQIPSHSETSRHIRTRQEQFFGVSVSQEFPDGEAPAVMSGSLKRVHPGTTIHGMATRCMRSTAGST